MAVAEVIPPERQDPLAEVAAEVAAARAPGEVVVPLCHPETDALLRVVPLVES
ncbi:MAG TPA: hypothetical protein VG405_06655 [Solirubrobacteraceae bacterium]|jgi:hypothetical protein|nr:hypothetical protein [Solirubrobacteraceae bacterium]